jgi:hypothetical protein
MLRASAWVAMQLSVPGIRSHESDEVRPSEARAGELVIASRTANTTNVARAITAGSGYRSTDPAPRTREA